MTKVVLASTSPYRKALLGRILTNFITQAPTSEEIAKQNEPPKALALRLAQEKADSLKKQFANHIIIGSDQVASFDGQILGKPGNFDKAFEQLSLQSGKQVSFYTGVAIINTSNNQSEYWVSEYTVTFQTLTSDKIRRYLEIEKPYNCAGSFKSEGLGVCLFETMEGEDPTSLIGLPLIKVAQTLESMGVDFFEQL